jgi:hypothetical protein
VPGWRGGGWTDVVSWQFHLVFSTRIEGACLKYVWPCRTKLRSRFPLDQPRGCYRRLFAQAEPTVGASLLGSDKSKPSKKKVKRRLKLNVQI